MNRRTFLKKLGVLAGLALVAPQALLETKAAGLTVADINLLKAKADAIENPLFNGNIGQYSDVIITGTQKARFNSTDYGVIAIDSKAKKLWAKDFLREAKAQSYFHKLMGKSKDSLIRVI